MPLETMFSAAFYVHIFISYDNQTAKEGAK